MSNTEKELLARRKILGPAYRLFYDEPIAPIKGDGVWLTDVNNQVFLDAYNNVPVLGHGNKAIAKAMYDQSLILNTHTRYLHHLILDYAESLLALFPSELDTLMLTCTGSEANDLALRIAEEYTGNRGIIVTDNAYHGVTTALSKISPSLHSIGNHVITVPAPCQLNGTPNEIAEQFAESINQAAVQLERQGIAVSALILDTVFASDGLYIENSACLKLAADTIHKHGGLFIADEVQGGFLRTGDNWWAFQRENVTPDIVTMGKPMGNGHPIAGLVIKSDLIKSFGERQRYFNTFGGNTVSAAVGLAVIKELKLLIEKNHVARIGSILNSEFNLLKEKYPQIVKDIRGKGLYWGIETHNGKLTAQESTKKIVNGLRNDGVLIGTSGKSGSVLKIRPPLIFNEDHVQILINKLEKQFKAVS